VRVSRFALWIWVPTAVALAVAGGHTLDARAARDSASSGYGTIRGVVEHGFDREPAAYGNVMILGSRLGAMTDEAGRFRLVEVPAGRVVLMILLPGDPRTLDTLQVIAGETLSVS